MMSQPEAGFREHEHTADWELEVWAPDLAALLEQAARGMYALAGVRLETSPRFERRLEIHGYDAEEKLVKFLSELLYLWQEQGLVFDAISLQVEAGKVSAALGGAAVLSQDKEIKAVTYHNLKIAAGPAGLRVRIIFDV